MKVLLKAGLAFLPALFLGLPPAAPAQIGIGIGIAIHTAPPILPVYAQPPCPQPGYMWQPGYWAWGPDGYYWVPGVWVEPPQPGLLWTPGYWGFVNGVYGWNAGYWGPEVGFYGGVDYGFGYPGQGFYGGMWRGSVFRYNVVVWHVGAGFHNVYRAPVAWHSPYHSRASFNGRGGIDARPTPREERAMHARHIQMTQAQRQHMQRAAQNRQNFYNQNHGHPRVAAEARIRAANQSAARNRAAANQSAARNRTAENQRAARNQRAAQNRRAEQDRARQNRAAQNRRAEQNRTGAAHPQARPGNHARPETRAEHPQARRTEKPSGHPAHATAHREPRGGGAPKDEKPHQ